MGIIEEWRRLRQGREATAVDKHAESIFSLLDGQIDVPQTPITDSIAADARINGWAPQLIFQGSEQLLFSEAQLAGLAQVMFEILQDGQILSQEDFKLDSHASMYRCKFREFIHSILKPSDRACDLLRAAIKAIDGVAQLWVTVIGVVTRNHADLVRAGTTNQWYLNHEWNQCCVNFQNSMFDLNRRVLCAVLSFERDAVRQNKHNRVPVLEH
jgi:hypothetical protein